MWRYYLNIKLVVFQWVDPSATRVAVVARGITITLGKQRNLFWMQLSRQKFGWIKKDPNAALDNDFDPAVEGLSEPGFISPYFTVAGQGKRYHSLTGEEILPETMGMSSDQEPEEEEFVKRLPFQATR